MGKDEKVSLATLLGGVAVERFDDELARVLANIVDPNTPAEAKREVTLKLSLKPDKGRDMGRVEVAVSSKLAPAEKLGTRMFISMTRSGPVATEHNPQQPMLPMSEAAPVTPLRPVPAGGAQ
jgi:hypothetical protein